MICLIALVVFAVLAVFSARYRQLALEAFDCVFRRLTLRKCTTGLDKRLKMKISARLLKKSPRLGRFAFKHFEAISWVFTIIMIASLVLTIQGAYNLWAFGNCNGPNSNIACVFNPAATGVKSDIYCSPSGHCLVNGCDCGINEENCNVNNNFKACDANCDCIKAVCAK